MHKNKINIFKELSEEELKTEFIRYFGEDKWNQEEVLGELQQVVFDVCKNWLGVEPIPILFGEHIGSDEARLDLEEQVIWLNPKNQSNWLELLDSTLHELEHLYQILYVSSYDTPKAKRWKTELENYITGDDPVGNILQEIEIDAMAFAQVVLATDYGINHQNENPIIQELIDRYNKSGKMLNDD